jgi:hypothetical protein
MKMAVTILDATPSEFTDADKVAHATAQQWLARITDLFLTERSFQQSIGISEVGSDCRKCVARKLSGMPKKPEGAWYPFIGTAVHQALEDGFARWDKEYNLEERLFVHEYKSLKLGGSCDMAAVTPDGTLIVNDWKVVGERALREASNGKIKDQYRIQAMLYGYGWAQKGHKVTHVALSFLPRDKDLTEAQVVMLRYDEQVAKDALTALEVMIDAAEIVGWDAVIEKQPKAGFCFDCKKYEQNEMGDVASLI